MKESIFEGEPLKNDFFLICNECRQTDIKKEQM